MMNLVIATTQTPATATGVEAAGFGFVVAFVAVVVAAILARRR